MPKTIKIFLKFFNNDLYYSLDDRDYQPMQEDTVTGADPEDTVQWECADESIEKISDIRVNVEKPGQNRRWKDIWAQEPTSASSDNRIFSGILQSEQEPIDDPAYNGYDIIYRVNGESEDRSKDPDIRVPP